MPERLYVRVSSSSTSVAVTGAPTLSPALALSDTERLVAGDAKVGGVVHRGDIDGNQGRVRQATSVPDLVGEAVPHRCSPCPACR